MTVRSGWFTVLLRSSVSLLIFRLVVLSNIMSGVLKSPIVIVELSVSLFNSISFCFIYFHGLSLGVQTFISVISFCRIKPFINM